MSALAINRENLYLCLVTQGKQCPRPLKSLPLLAPSPLNKKIMLILSKYLMHKYGRVDFPVLL